MSSRRFAKGDRVMVASLKSAVTKRAWLSSPLRYPPPVDQSKLDSTSNKTPNGYPPNTPLIHLNFGKLAHTDILDTIPSGKIYEVVTAKKELSAKYRITHPTLEEYINLTNRKAQPIYALDASAIVSLMDLHLDSPNVEWIDGKPHIKEVSQFLEAGTGHGSLSLAIAKALQPANGLARSFANNPDSDLDVDLRGAILHSIDCNKAHSHQGKETVEGFRRGQYAQNVEFHVAESPSSWLDDESSSNQWALKSQALDPESLEFQTDGKAWLDGIFLDMPSYDKQLVRLCKDLKVDGRIIVFCPSINQILDGVKEIDNNNEITRESMASNGTNYPFTSEGGSPAGMLHEKTIQLLPGMGGGLQEWDTRKTLIKATGETGYTVRPKVGMRTVAGGFISIWRKVSFQEVLYGSKPALKEEVKEDVILPVEENEVNETQDTSVKESEETKSAPKFKAYTFETVSSRQENGSTFSQSKAESEVYQKSTSSPPMSDFMKRFLSNEPSPPPETKPLEVTAEEQDEASNISQEEEYELPSNQEMSPVRLFPIEALKTVYKNCSGEVHVGYITHVNVVDIGKLPEYAFEGQIKPTGPSKP